MARVGPEAALDKTVAERVKRLVVRDPSVLLRLEGEHLPVRCRLAQEEQAEEQRGKRVEQVERRARSGSERRGRRERQDDQLLAEADCERVRSEPMSGGVASSRRYALAVSVPTGSRCAAALLNTRLKLSHRQPGGNHERITLQR